LFPLLWRGGTAKRWVRSLGRTLRYNSIDPVQDSPEILEQSMIGHAMDEQPLRYQKSCPAFITSDFMVFAMRRAINLDDHPVLMIDEVNNVRAYGNLSVEFQTAQSTIAQSPQRRLSPAVGSLRMRLARA
jgi:hypothetical protein